MNLREKFSNKKVFITGITGFKGSWLALALKELGAEVYGLGLEQENPNSIYHTAEISSFSTVFYTDIRDLLANKEVYTVMTSCDYVFHLAAQPLVSTGYTNPIMTFEVNLMGTLYIQEVLRTVTHPLTFINVTTDKVYKPSPSNSHSEDGVLKGEGPYSLSKSFSDMATELYKETYFNNEYIKSYVVRAGNVIGGGDFSKDRIVVDIIDSIFLEEKLSLRNPNSVRPYQYVIDCIIQYLYVAAFGKEFEYNIGPDKETIISTIDLVKSFDEITKISYDYNGKSVGKEDQFLTLNTDRFKSEFGVVPYADSVEKLVKSTFEWYNNLYNRKNMVEFSKNHIREVLNHYEQA